MSGTRISKKTSLTCDINIKYYSFESTPTESSAGGILFSTFLILSHINHAWALLKKSQVESTFTEKINSKQGSN